MRPVWRQPEWVVKIGTTPEGIVYPDDSSPIANLQDDLQALAESVDVAIAPVTYSTGDLGLATMPGWSLNSLQATRIGVLRLIQCNVAYSGSTITGTSTGNLHPTQTVLTGLPADWRPAATAVFPFTRQAITFGTGHISGGGTDVYFSCLHAGGTISSGQTVTFAALYLAL